MSGPTVEEINEKLMERRVEEVGPRWSTDMPAYLVKVIDQPNHTTNSYTEFLDSHGVSTDDTRRQWNNLVYCYDGSVALRYEW